MSSYFVRQLDFYYNFNKRSSNNKYSKANVVCYAFVVREIQLYNK